MSARRRFRAAITAAIAALVVAPLAATAPANAVEPFPEFVYQGVITDKSEMLYNPTNEFIFPSVFHAAEYLDDPLGEWYLYLAPHDRPAGIMLMYADSLDGPWTEYGANPIIASDWAPYYDVSHVSSPDAIWNEEAGEVYLYFHGENSITRYATSTDGVSFDYGGTAVTNAMGGSTETSYARVFEHPDEASEYAYAMFYMANFSDNHRRLKVAESVDGETWVVRDGTLVDPESGDSGNVSGGNLYEYEGQLYVIYHNSAGRAMARTIDETLTDVGPSQLLHQSSGVGEDVGRTAAPEIVTDGEFSYLFYESGDRLGATIAWAKAGPGVEGPGGPDPVAWPVDPDNPVFAQCAAEGSDEFDGTELSDVWDRVVREETARHVVADGVLSIPAYPSGVSGASLPQQELPEGPWQVTTKVTIDVAERFQQAGLLLYASDTAYGKFDLGRATPGKTLEVVQYLNGSNRQDTAAPAVPEADTVWLRMTSDGVKFQSSVSYDGASFSDYGRPFLLSETGFTHIGPYAFRGATGAEEIDGEFDWFRWSPTPEEYEACLADVLPDDDETDAPGKASLTSTSGWEHGLDDGNFEVRMDLWWGTNATRFRLYQDDALIASVPLEPASPQAQHAVVPIEGLPNGTYEFRGELANSQGTTATKAIRVKVTDASPGEPVLSHDDYDGTFTLSADLWWGTNADAWRLLQDGVEVAAGSLEAATPAAQHVEVPFTGLEGVHEFVIEFSNGAGTTASEPLTVG